MSIISTFKSFERYLKNVTDSGVEYQLMSERTHARDVIFDDGNTVDEKISGVEATLADHNHLNNVLSPTGIELYNASTENGGYIDFHYNISAANYTSRIVENAHAQINIEAVNGVTVNDSKVITKGDFTFDSSTGKLTLTL